jgi:hypothetical protein
MSLSMAARAGHVVGSPLRSLLWAYGVDDGEDSAEKKIVLPPFFSAAHEEAPQTANSNSSGASNAESWELMPDDVLDPRYDRHGFRRSAHSKQLAEEDAFENTYADRLKQQEVRWARKIGASTDVALDGSRAELKRLVRQGIPSARRKSVWAQCSRAAELRATCPEGYFAELLAQPAATSPSEPGFAAERQIDLDLARTFPGHRLLSSADGAAQLRSVLIAYARRDPRVGYVQGMGFVGALLLVFLEEPEDAFWCLCATIELLLPPDFYSTTLLGLRVEQVWLDVAGLTVYLAWLGLAWLFDLRGTPRASLPCLCLGGFLVLWRRSSLPCCGAAPHCRAVAPLLTAVLWRRSSGGLR